MHRGPFGTQGRDTLSRVTALSALTAPKPVFDLAETRHISVASGSRHIAPAAAKEESDSDLIRNAAN
jgi:hypothetical protein